jgi:hypothetical protein
MTDKVPDIKLTILVLDPLISNVLLLVVEAKVTYPPKKELIRLHIPIAKNSLFPFIV